MNKWTWRTPQTQKADEGGHPAHSWGAQGHSDKVSRNFIESFRVDFRFSVFLADFGQFT